MFIFLAGFLSGLMDRIEEIRCISLIGMSPLDRGGLADRPLLLDLLLGLVRVEQQSLGHHFLQQ